MTSTDRPRLRGTVLFALVLALAALLSWARVTANIDYPPGSLERVAGLVPVPPELADRVVQDYLPASKPFLFRQLVPRVVRALWELTGRSISLMRVFHVLDVAAIVGIFYAMRRLARDVLSSELAAQSAAFALLFSLPFQFILVQWLGIHDFWYAWDMTTVLFMVVGLILLRARRWGLFYPFFVVATLNRETTFLLSLVYAVTAIGRDTLARIVVHVLAQAAIWFAIRFGLIWLFPKTIPPWLTYYRPVAELNLALLGQPRTYLFLASNFGFAWLLVIAGWKYIRDPWIKRALVIVPVHALLMFRAGIIVEMRIWAELSPVVILAAEAVWQGWRESRERAAALPARA